jgi:probable RNA-binding protein EIF1AD
MARPKRNVLAAAEESLTPPAALEPHQSLVRVTKPEGSNVWTCELPGGKPILLELAQRFRNTIWIKRGGFVLAERYQESTEETRAAGEIINVVRDEKLWRKQSYWPKEFNKARDLSDDEEESNMGKMPPSDSEDE